MLLSRSGRIGAAGLAIALLAGALMLASAAGIAATNQAQVFAATDQRNANPGVVPNQGQLYADLSIKWWLWAFSFPALETPFFNLGGPVDIGAGQSGHVWFLAGSSLAAGGANVTRSGIVPTGTMLFLPIANAVNDYPCPDPTFVPEPGETLEHFLQRTVIGLKDFINDPFAEIDGVPLAGLSKYWAMSSLFTFRADAALATLVPDPCITGTPQVGVAAGYWLLIAPLTPGQHTLHFGAPSWGQDITYLLTVRPGR